MARGGAGDVADGGERLGENDRFQAGSFDAGRARQDRAARRLSGQEQARRPMVAGLRADGRNSGR